MKKKKNTIYPATTLSVLASGRAHDTATNLFRSYASCVVYLFFFHCVAFFFSRFCIPCQNELCKIFKLVQYAYQHFFFVSKLVFSIFIETVIFLLEIIIFPFFFVLSCVKKSLKVNLNSKVSVQLSFAKKKSILQVDKTEFSLSSKFFLFFFDTLRLLQRVTL